jgi:glutamyl-tRNA synthetase
MQYTKSLFVQKNKPPCGFVAICGVKRPSVTPGGATELLEMMGREISLERLKKSLANLTAL